MRRFLVRSLSFLSLMVWSLLSLSADSAGYVISGKVTGFKDGEVIMLRDFGINQVIAKTQVKGGEFSFSGRVDEPRLYMLSSDYGVENFVALQFFVENSKITIEADRASFKFGQVNGSKAQKVEDKYLDMIRPLTLELDEIENKVGRDSAVEVPEAERARLSARYQEIYSEIKETQREFIERYPNSYAALYKFSSFLAAEGGPEKTAHLDLGVDLKTYYADLSPELKNSFLGKKMFARVFGEKAEVGKPFVDFELTAMGGEKFMLSDVKSEYILLEFTAVDCSPCKEFADDMLKRYGRLKGNLEVVASYNDVDLEYFQEYIEEKGIDWMVTCDGEGYLTTSRSQYQVEGDPTFFLIKDGVIIREQKGYPGDSFLDEIEKTIGQ